MNKSLTNEFDSVLESVPIKIFYGISFCLSEFIALSCYFGFIYFEYNCGDPLKRSLKNKLFTQICKSFIFQYLTHNPGFACRVLIGPFNENLTMFFIFSQKLSGTFNVLCFTEIILHKVSMLFGFKHFCLTNEEFVFMFINMFNFGFSFGAQFSCWMLGTYTTFSQFEIFSATFSLTKFKNHNVFWPIFMTINFTIVFFGCLALSIKKYLMYKTNQNMIQEVHIGIANPPVINNNFNKIQQIRHFD